MKGLIVIRMKKQIGKEVIQQQMNIHEKYKKL